MPVGRAQTPGEVRVQDGAELVEVLAQIGGDVVAPQEPEAGERAPVQVEVLGLLTGAEQQVGESRAAATASTSDGVTVTWVGARPADCPARVSGSRRCATSSSGWIRIRRRACARDRPLRSVSRNTVGAGNGVRAASPSGTRQAAVAAGTATIPAPTSRVRQSRSRSGGPAGRTSRWIRCRRAPTTRSARRRGGQISGTATRSGRSRARSASSAMASARSTSRRAEGSMSCPNGVNRTARDDLSNSRAPKCSSRAATRRLATDWGMPAAAAPEVKLPCPLTATKARQAATTSTCRTYTRDRAATARPPGRAVGLTPGTIVAAAGAVRSSGPDTPGRVSRCASWSRGRSAGSDTNGATIHIVRSLHSPTESGTAPGTGAPTRIGWRRQ